MSAGKPQTLARAQLRLDDVLESPELLEACAEADALGPAGRSLAEVLCEEAFVPAPPPRWWVRTRQGLHALNGLGLGATVGLGITRGGLAHQPVWYWAGLLLGCCGLVVQHRDLRRSIRRAREAEARL